jgi:ABC-type polysaccharide/polyol phosphate export permease
MPFQQPRVDKNAFRATAEDDGGMAARGGPSVAELVPEAAPAPPSPATRALQDIVEGIQRWELWVAMGIQGVKRRYRRSILGPLWLTLSLAIMVAVMSLLYGRLLNVPLDRYVPHLALGFIAWQFIQGVVSDGCNVFTSHKGWITSARWPLSLFVYKAVWENTLTMAHNALVYVGVAAIFRIFAGLPGLLLIPGLALVFINAIWMSLLFGALCARYRDIAPIVQSIMRVAFFVTPVIWMPNQLGTRAHLALYNPFTYFIELIRAPLLGEVPPLLTWMLALAVTAVGCLITWLFYVRFRSRVPYWL